MTLKTSIELPWPYNALSPNGQGTKNIHARNRYFQKYKKEAFYLAKTMKPSKNLIITFHPRSKAQDKDNAIAWFKAGQDGLAEAWGINDRDFNIQYRMAEKGTRKNPRVEVEPA
jgi:crossover junction endodeoxyribonuclease RusA